MAKYGKLREHQLALRSTEIPTLSQAKALVAFVNFLIDGSGYAAYLAGVPKSIALGFPTRWTKDGKLMANYELKNDQVVNFPIQTKDSAGDVVPAPTGDVFSAKSSNPVSLDVVIANTPSGAAGVTIKALVQQSPNLSFTISDTSGLTVWTQGVDIVVDASPTNIVLDLVDATITSQPVPTNPGP